MAGIEIGERLIPRAGEARVITGEARNTVCGANGLLLFTSGALLPRQLDGLIFIFNFQSSWFFSGEGLNSFFFEYVGGPSYWYNALC